MGRGRGQHQTKARWWRRPDQSLFIPRGTADYVVKQYRDLTQWGKTVLEHGLPLCYFTGRVPTLCAQISTRCTICANNNAGRGPKQASGSQSTGTAPSEDMEMDFTEVEPCRGYACRLVFVHTYSKRAEAIPTHTKKAQRL